MIRNGHRVTSSDVNEAQLGMVPALTLRQTRGERMPLRALRALVADDLRDEFDRLAAPIDRDMRIMRTLLDGALQLVTTILPDQEDDRLLGATTEPLAAVDHVDLVDLRVVDAGADQQA